MGRALTGPAARGRRAAGAGRRGAFRALPVARPVTRPAALLAAALLAVSTAAGCTGPTPTPVPGPAAPATRAEPSRPAPLATPSGTPSAPVAYVPYTVERPGLSATLAVPAGWSLTRTAHGVDFGDPTGSLLLRLEIRPRQATDSRAAWEATEPSFRRSLPGYRRLGLVEVPGVGESAADLSFTFTRGGVTRQVVDRGIGVGRQSLAIYFSAPQESYARTSVVFDRANRDLRLS